jgi:hypothetical protein
LTSCAHASAHPQAHLSKQFIISYHFAPFWTLHFINGRAALSLFLSIYLCRDSSQCAQPKGLLCIYKYNMTMFLICATTSLCVVVFLNDNIL